MMKRKSIPALVLTLVWCVTAWAVETAYLGDSSAQDFGAGERDNVYVDRDGQVVLGPARTVLVEGVDYVWCVAVAQDGTVYAGTVPGGKIYRASGGKSEVFFDTGEAGVFSLALLSDGSLIAGTGANGKVFKVSADGQGSLLAALDAQHVFGLAVAAGDKIYAATGGASGRIYRIQGGSSEVFYESPSAHLTAVALAPDGAVYASSGDRGAVYRISPDGKGAVVFSAPQRVVQDIAIGEDGSVFAATASIAEERPGADEEAVKSIISEIQARKQDPGPNPAPAAPPARRTYRVANSVYRIMPDGRVQSIFGLNGGLIMSVLPDGKRILCAAAGQPGIFAVELDERRSARLFESKSDQVLDLAADPKGGFVAAFGMPGQAVHFGSQLARTGVFTSRVLDAKGFVKWGRLRWTGEVPTGTTAGFAVRSGNTPVVDPTWIEWRTLDAVSGGVETGLPTSRFAQYRVNLATAAPDTTPRVREVALAGLPVNLAPVISDIGAGKEPPRGAAAQPPPARDAGESGQKEQPKSSDSPALSGLVNVYWKADDPNADRLKFTLSFRQASMSRFIMLSEDLSESKYAWDTTTVPDGQYFLRVTASDAPSNPAGTEAVSTREAGPFTVDNTPPVLTTPSVTKTDTGYTVELQVSDAASPIAAASYSVDSGKWEPLLPVDGIFDSPNERIVVKVDKPEAAIVVIKVTDRAGNSGAVIAEIK